MMHRLAVRAYKAKKVAVKWVLGSRAAKHGAKKAKGRTAHSTRAGVKYAAVRRIKH